MAQGRQQNNGSRQRCAQSAAAKASTEPPKAVCAQLEQLNRKLAAASLRFSCSSWAHTALGGSVEAFAAADWAQRCREPLFCCLPCAMVSLRSIRYA